MKVSVVIICRNEAEAIAQTLSSLHGLTDDIVVYDNGSTDNTEEVVRGFNVNFHKGSWEGFGPTKNKANALARYNWILSLDADESPDDELISAISTLEGRDGEVYDLPFKNFLGSKHLKYGEWGDDHHVRIFNRDHVKWDDALVHEKLLLPRDCRVVKLKGYVLHRTMKDLNDYSTKMVKYAMMNAEKYARDGKKYSWWKLRLSPTFTFIKFYIFKLGFLDGHEGYICAKMTAWYTFLKYARLRELNKISAPVKT